MPDQPARPAMTMREIREALGHVQPGTPEPTIQPIGYLVTCLPEGHDDRWTFTIQVRYSGHGLWAVKHGSRHYGTDGTWSYEPDHGEDDGAETAWLAAHRFDHDTALKLARELAPALTYRGHSVADALGNPTP
ncbi:hypothetical protein ACIRQP_14840 [Streptomyces sp. NPDC102274]|uniref:hypothetical protein n=1 Tax=Streptomyces sp. NPDC102274 TaxID=3366151 RepID=UPI0038110F74